MQKTIDKSAHPWRRKHSKTVKNQQNFVVAFGIFPSLEGPDSSLLFCIFSSPLRHKFRVPTRHSWKKFFFGRERATYLSKPYSLLDLYLLYLAHYIHIHTTWKGYSFSSHIFGLLGNPCSAAEKGSRSMLETNWAGLQDDSIVSRENEEESPTRKTNPVILCGLCAELAVLSSHSASRKRWLCSGQIENLHKTINTS